jgi:tetratricopeptide (TPR) repeat protein
MDTNESIDIEDLCKKALEQIKEFALKKDFQSVEILADQYLKVHKSWKVQQYATMAKMHLRKYEEARLLCKDNIKKYNLAEDLNNMALIERASGNKKLAYKYAKKAYKLKPDSAPIVGNYAIISKMLKQNSKAYNLLEDALKLDSKNLLFNFNKAAMLAESGKLEKSKAQFEKVLELDPTDPNTHVDYFYLLMNMQLYKKAWPYYESRYKKNGQLATMIQKFGKPVYQIKQKYYEEKICIIPEQGLGDNLMFLRFVANFQKIAPNSTYFAPKPIQKFAESMGLRVIEKFDDSSSHVISIMSLPYHLGIQKIPKIDSPLKHQPCKSDKLRVGLCWAGSPYHPMDATRSTHLRWYESFLEDKDLEIYSFQKDRRPRKYAYDQKIYDYSTGFEDYKIIDLAPELTDAWDTALAMNKIDVFISVDTFPVHIAGSIGVPSYVIVSEYPDFRWGRKRKNSDWYESIKIVRKTTTKTYMQVISELHKKIKSGI